MADHDEGRVQAYTVRLELSDEPGQLLRALKPIADHGGNLLSVFHERGSLTPRGNIPVEVDFECHPNRFETIVAALRTASINVIRAGAERYDEEITVILTGHIIDTDVSDTLSRITTESNASVVDISLSAPEGTSDVSSARLRLATDSTETNDVLDTVATIAGDKELRVIQPLTDGEVVA